jgi:hypothetical protein
MTDDEISASICSVVGFPADLIPNDMEIAIYRAGMREAARIALRGLLLTTERDGCLGYNATIYAISGAIERAAGGEG